MSERSEPGGKDTGFSQAEGLSELSAIEAIDSPKSEESKSSYKEDVDKHFSESSVEPKPIMGGSGEAAKEIEADETAAPSEADQKSESLKTAQQQAKGLKGRARAKADKEIEGLAKEVREARGTKDVVLKSVSNEATAAESPKPETGPNYEHNPNKAQEMAKAEKAYVEAGLAARKAGRVEKARELFNKVDEKRVESATKYDEHAAQLKEVAEADADMVTDKVAKFNETGEAFEMKIDYSLVKDGDDLKTQRGAFLDNVGAKSAVWERANKLGGLDQIYETVHDKTKVVVIERANGKGQLIATKVIAMKGAMESRGNIVQRAFGRLRAGMRGEKFKGDTKPSKALLAKFDSIGETPSSAGDMSPSDFRRKKRPEEE